MFLKCVLAVVLLKFTSSHVIENGIGLNILLKSESSSKTYYIGKSKANALVASSTCSQNSKTLLALETEEEFNEITRILEQNGIESVWTSGMQTVTNVSTRYSWVPNGEARQMEKYVQLMIEPDFELQSVGEFLSRKRRSVNWHGSAPHQKHHSQCGCDDLCPAKPNCTHIECEITPAKCTVEDRHCETDDASTCSIIHESNCTVTCPECTIKRGTCTVTRAPCTVTPGKCETRRENCRVEQPPCRLEGGDCQIIEEGCEVIQPVEPCPEPPTCSCNLNNTCPKSQRLKEELRKLNCTNGDCKLPYPIPGEPCSGSGCPDAPTPEPCKGECCSVMTCVRDIVCKPPPVVCKPPIYHCLTPDVICPPATVVCDDPITVCDPPQVFCPDYEKKCTDDVIVCPPPQTVCTPAVSYCTPSNLNCSSASMMCEKPEVNCPELPKCEVPDECYNPSPCNCPNGKRHKRSIDGSQDLPSTGVFFENEDVIEMNCVGIQQNQKWEIEGCEGEKWFVCEGN